ncbi:hypothetical protein H2248_010984 [Termitomyces sp. 'cryptogamus']|nr:hypothetical protein H2248_010984 [Termitomyces sp. 'cryptogamus']
MLDNKKFGERLRLRYTGSAAEVTGTNSGPVISTVPLTSTQAAIPLVPTPAPHGPPLVAVPVDRQSLHTNYEIAPPPHAPVSPSQAQVNPGDLRVLIQKDDAQLGSFGITMNVQLNLNDHTGAARVTATIIPSEGIDWSSEDLQMLAYGFRLLYAADKQDHRATEISVLPPTDDVPPGRQNMSSNPLSLPWMGKLTWKSHRNQLPIMLHATRMSMELTHLTLYCDIPLQECERLLQILAHALSTFEVHRVVESVFLTVRTSQITSLTSF